MPLLGDLRLGFRSLLKNPGFTAVAVAMLAIGIGVNATVFTVTNAVLFKGFPMVDRNDRLLYITPKDSNCCVSYPDFLDYRSQAKSFQGMAIAHGVSKTLNDGSGLSERLDANESSANTFEVVGRKPILGRDFTPSDEQPGAPPVAILSYGFWERRYGKNPAVIGQTVRMNGAPTTLIGVMPQGFSFPQKVDVWVPLVRTERVMNRENRDTWMAFGRLADGVTIEAARSEMDIIGKRLAIAYPVTGREHPPLVQKFDEFFIGPNAALIYGSMWGAVGFVLLIACANLANLLLGRAYSLAMAQKASWLIVDYTMDSRVLAYLIAISIGTGIVFGLAPALRLSNLDVNASLKDGGRAATSGGRGRYLSALLVTGEMALAIVLLAGAGVMIRRPLYRRRAFCEPALTGAWNSHGRRRNLNRYS